MQLLNSLKNNSLIKNSAIFFTGVMAFNILNYIYHLAMSRMLSVQDFGELESLFSIIYLVLVPATALMTVAMKYISLYRAENNLAKASVFLKKFNKRLLGIGALIILFSIAFSQPIADFLKLNSFWPVILMGGMVVFSMLAYLGQGVLQGWQKFKGISIALIIYGILKVALAILLVWLSLGVSGAVGGMMLATVIFYFMVIYLLKFLFVRQSEKTIERQQILQYCLPVFITLLSVTALYSMDMMLVKHFFDAETAGNYGALAVLGKIIFFATAPLIGVMFPMVSESHHLKGDYRKILKQSFGLFCLVGLTPVVLYFLLPKIAITLLVGSKFLIVAPYLGWLGLAIFFVSLINFFANFFLSVQKTGFVYFTLIGALALITLINFYHQNLWQIIWVMNGVMVGTCLLLFGYFLKIKNKI